MSGISKAILAAALIAFGLVAGEDLARGLAAPGPFPAQVAVSDATAIEDAALRKRAARTLQILLEKQASGQAAPLARSKCDAQTWPYYSSECLVGSHGETVPGAVRIVRPDRTGPDAANLAKPVFPAAKQS